MRNNLGNRVHILVHVRQLFETNDQQHIQTAETKLMVQRHGDESDCNKQRHHYCEPFDLIQVQNPQLQNLHHHLMQEDMSFSGQAFYLDLSFHTKKSFYSNCLQDKNLRQ